MGEIVRDKSLTARAVYGLFPANSVGDDVELYTDESRTEVLTKFHFLRQQMDKEEENRKDREQKDREQGTGNREQDNAPNTQHATPDTQNSVNYCLADFVAPKETGLRDYFGGFAVTAGVGSEAN